MSYPTIYCFIVSFIMLCSQVQAQCYQRIPLVGDASVAVITKTVVSPLKNKADYKKPQPSIQFQRNGMLISINTLKIATTADIKGFNHQTDAQQLVQYTRDVYSPVDSTSILFECLQAGKLENKYPFADVLDVSRSGCSDDTFDHFELKERLIIMDDYVYILNVLQTSSCITEKETLKIKRMVQRQFNRLIHSFKIHKK